MAFVHGKNTAVTLDGEDLSPYINDSSFKRAADKHDTTTYGRNSKTYLLGLNDGTCEISGIYDNTTLTSPAGILRPLQGGAAVTLVWMPEGDGSGLPTSTVPVLVESYDETAPVADLVAWTATLQFTGDVVDGVVAP